MDTTPGLKLPIPDLTEMADGPDAFSDLGLAIESFLYDRTLPVGVTRVPSYFWGAGTTPPSGALLRTGDTYRHTSTGPLLYNGTDWVEVGRPIYVQSTAPTGTIPDGALWFQVS